MVEPTAAEWAWIAGLFEGEGNIHDVPPNSVQLRIRMNDRDVLEKLELLIPSASGVIPRGRRQPHHGDQFEWMVGRRDVVEATLAGMLPWLGSRRSDRSRRALARMAGAVGHNRDKTHCKFGHPFSGENLYVNPRGKRVCRICKTRHRADMLARRAVSDG